MKNIKVYLRYPFKVSDSQYYRSLIENPPKDITYLFNVKKIGMVTNKIKFYFLNFLKRSIRYWLKLLNLPIPNAYKTVSKKDYDLIHCAHCLSKNENKPWVADFESWWQMWISGRDTKMGISKVRKILLNKNCKKILPWTEQAKKDILARFPEIEDKVEVVYFAQPFKKFKKIKTGEIRLLFISRYFYDKGGLHALEAMDRLTKKYKNVKAMIISETPEKIIRKYSMNKKISFRGLTPHDKIIKEIFPSTDIYIYPGYSDTFGFTFTEAMSFGVPVVTIDGFARKEIIENEKTGFVITRPKSFGIKDLVIKNEEIVNELVKTTSNLIENKKLLKKMSKNCIKEVRDGKFSLKERNKKLRKIYEETFINQKN
tara:strand:+ start:2839 stop:3951 length:1113 start_codon:yes stop_codon:yes gene_type:complete